MQYVFILYIYLAYILDFIDIYASKMLLVLSAPSKHDSYYRKHFEKMIEFYILYVKAIHGHDNVVLLADKDTMPYFTKHLPNDILLTVSAELDPWLRDVSPVMPDMSIQFKFVGGLKMSEAKFFQKQFDNFIDEHLIDRIKVDFVNDGGNFIDNGRNCVITTNKFLKLNKLKESDGISLLKDIFKVEFVAIVPADDEKLGHIDGMCSFLNEKTLFMVRYEDEKFRAKIKAALEKYLPGDINIVEIECNLSSKKAKGGFSSAYGLYVNCVPTEKFIYVPVFSDPFDEAAKETFKAHSGNKECIFVDALNVSHLGGSLRCLSWQVVGENAEKLIKAAKVGPPF